MLIGTTHSETGIFIHPNGRSEGCILFDLENIIGKKSFYDLRGRVVGENKILRGRINSVVDKRPIADRENYPVYYSDNPKYRKED